MTQAMTFAQVKEVVKKYLSTKKNPEFVLCLVSSPGMGKTAMMKQLAKELGLNLTTISCSSITKQTFSLSFVIENKLTSLTLDTLSDQNAVLFLEEIDRTPVSVAPILLPLLSGRVVGNVEVKCKIVATANYVERIENIDAALPTRFIFIHLKTEVSELFQYLSEKYAPVMDDKIETILTSLRMTCDNHEFSEQFNPRQIDHLVEYVAIVKPEKMDDILAIAETNLPREVYETFANHVIYTDLPPITDAEKYLDFIFSNRNPTGKHYFGLRRLVLHIANCDRKNCTHPNIQHITKRLINATPTLIDTFTSALLDVPEDKRAEMIDQMMKTPMTQQEQRKLIETLDLISRLTRQ